MPLNTILSALRAPLALGLLAVLAAVVVAGAPAHAEQRFCRACDFGVDGTETIRVSFPDPDGGRRLVSTIVVLTDAGAFAAAAPRYAEADIENRINVRGFIGDAGGLERAFDRSLLAYVSEDRFIGPVYFRDGALIVDLRGVGGVDDVVERGGVAILTRAPAPYRLVGLRLELSFAPARLGDGALGPRFGDAYVAPGGLVLAPPPRALPGL